MPIIRYSESAPVPALSEFVECFWTVVVDAAGDAQPEHRVLPDGCGVLSFRLGQRSTIGVRPPSMKPFRARAHAGEHSIGVRFRPGAFARLRPEALAQITSREYGAPALHDARAIVEWELSRAIRTAGDPDARIGPMVALLRRAHGNILVREVAEQADMSERQLERLCHRSLRIGPKAFARTVRLQAVIRKLIADPAANLASVAAEFGFSDQAHLGRDFTDLGNLAPSAYLRTLQAHSISLRPMSDLF